MNTILFLPGLSADERMFHSIRNDFKHSQVLNWIEPKYKEPLSDYAYRLKQELKNDRKYFIVGVSFGGIVALELSKHINSTGCLLVGSISSPYGISFSNRQLLKLFRLDSKKIIEASKFLHKRFSKYSPNHLRSKTRIFTGTKARFYSWAFEELSKWKPERINTPIYHVHGSNDEIFSINRVRPTKIIDGGKHNIMLSHSDVISRYIKEILGQHN